MWHLDLNAALEELNTETKEKKEFKKKLEALIAEYDIEEYIFVAEVPKYTHGGFSVTRIHKKKNSDTSPIKLLRNTLDQWEEKHNLDPNEDWSK